MAGNKRSRSASSSDTSNSQSEGRRSPKRLQKGRNRSRSRDRYRYPRDSRDRSREHRNSRRYDDDRRHDSSDRHVSRRARSPETRRPEPSDRSLGDRHRSHHRDQLDARPASDGPPDLLSIHRYRVLAWIAATHADHCVCLVCGESERVTPSTTQGGFVGPRCNRSVHLAYLWLWQDIAGMAWYTVAKCHLT